MKEPTGNKGPRLTGNISLPGKYLILQPHGQGVNISRKINTETERSRLRALGVLIKPPSTGLLFRTEAEQIKEELLIEDLENLIQQWDQVLRISETTHPPSLINRDKDFSLKILRDCIKSSTNKIIIDNKSALEKAKDFLVNNDQAVDLVFHNNEANVHILEKYQINKTIQKALQPRVDLPSGGYIIIEPTEALTVIDVNSGSFTRSANSRQTVLWTNCEAAIEISRQMKLRNIGGVLVIDFIDMESRRDQFQLLEQFTLAIKDDSARPQIAQLTELGLVELTRKRQGQNIYELFGQKCNTCNGLGHLENLPNYQNSNLETNQATNKSYKLNNTKFPELEPLQVSENQEKLVKKELPISKNLNKEDDFSKKKENNNEIINTNNIKEKKVITVELSNDEKLVYSQLGINPLVKLGKEYLTNNNLVRLEDRNNNEKQLGLENNKKLKHKVSSKKSNKKTSISNSIDNFAVDESKEVDSDNKFAQKISEEEKIEITDGIDNSRRKRRRSSASIE